MKIGIRGKLFFVSLLLIAAVGTATGLYAEHEMRQGLESRIENELSRHAHGIAAILDAAALTRPTDLQSLAQNLGHSTRMRVTVLRQDGHVLADSDLTAAEIPFIESHLDRPEVQQSLQTGHGASRRQSSTVGAAMLYVAVPYRSRIQGESGIVRVAMPLTAVEAAVARLRWLLLVTALLGLAVAVFMSALASHLLSRVFQGMVDTARTLSRGGTGRIAHSSDEIGHLAGSFNRLTEELECTMTTLAYERDRFEAVLEGMREAVIAFDGNDRITLVNRAATDMLGTGTEAVGKPFLDVVRVPTIVQLAHQSRTAPSSAEVTLREPQRHVLAQATPLRTSGDTVMVLHDMTAMKRLERIRRDFVANVSHELRTPVSIIRANAETLAAGAINDPDHGIRFLQALERNAQRLADIVSDLLDLSRIEGGRTAFNIGPVGFRAAAHRAIESVAAEAAKKAQQISLEVSENAFAMADAKALDHVLLNLLENAVKYTPSGCNITIVGRVTSEGARLEVVDNGPGIEQMHRERIFERFYRVDAGRSRETGGTGLGLAIVKHLVEAMDGEVGVSPNLPHGSRFWVKLPLVPSREDARVA